MISYHGGHSKDHCCHADNTLKEILDAYTAANFQYVGVTEHLPSWGDYLYEEEKPLGETTLEARFRQLMDGRTQLHKQYDNKFADFRVGFETEFYGNKPTEYVCREVRWI